MLPAEEEVAIPTVAELTVDEQVEPGTGVLKVQVKTGNQAIPIEGAMVTVFDQNQSTLTSAETDYDGLSEHVVPINDNEHILVNITVRKDGFIDMNYVDVTIYEGHRSIQSAELVPEIDGKKEITYNES